MTAPQYRIVRYDHMFLFQYIRKCFLPTQADPDAAHMKTARSIILCLIHVQNVKLL